MGRFPYTPRTSEHSESAVRTCSGCSGRCKNSNPSPWINSTNAVDAVWAVNRIIRHSGCNMRMRFAASIPSRRLIRMSLNTMSGRNLPASSRASSSLYSATGLKPCFLKISERVSASTRSSSITRTVRPSDPAVMISPVRSENTGSTVTGSAQPSLDLMRTAITMKKQETPAYMQFHERNQADTILLNNPLLHRSISIQVRSCLEKRRRKSLILLRCSVSSAISCIVIKSNRQSEKTPLLGEVVRVDDRNGFFIVLDVDRKRRVAQLMERSGKHRLVDIPFAFVRPFKRNLTQVIERFLEAREDEEKRRRRPDRT